jgi:hypothetical protein
MLKQQLWSAAHHPPAPLQAPRRQQLKVSGGTIGAGTWCKDKGRCIIRKLCCGAPRTGLSLRTRRGFGDPLPLRWIMLLICAPSTPLNPTKQINSNCKPCCELKGLQDANALHGVTPAASMSVQC